MTAQTSTAGAPSSASAPGKVNLLLRVGPTDAQCGKHALLTVFHALDLWERVEISPGRGEEDRVITRWGKNGEHLTDLDTPEHLALRALRLLREEYDLDGGPVVVEVEKHVPVAGGMAGGSADAAATLLAANRYFGLGLSREALAALGARLGADVPFGLYGGTCLGRGFGDRIAPLNHPQHWWALAFMRQGLSTPAVFRAYDALAQASSGTGEDTGGGSVEDAGRDLRGAGGAGGQVELADLSLAQSVALTSPDPAALAAALENELQGAALSLRPELAEVIRLGEKAGGLRALVSGSGPTVAVLCAGAEAAQRVAAALPAHEAVAASLAVPSARL